MHKIVTHIDNTISSLIQRYAVEQTAKRVFTFLLDGEFQEQNLTYGDLDRKARAIGARLKDFKLKGERVLLLYPQGLEFITALLGCFYAGAVAVPCYPPRINRSNPHLETIAADCQAAAALTITQYYSGIKQMFTERSNLTDLCLITTDNLEDEWAVEWVSPEVMSSDLAFLQYTSGSTASPKGVMVSHGNLMCNLETIQRCFHTSTETRGVFWLPFYHDMGLIGGILGTIYCGGTSILFSPLDFSQRPLRWLQAISRTQATISGGPNFAYDLCTRMIQPEERELLDLSSWELAFNGAEPVHYETLERFITMFTSCGFRPEAFYPCYGLAESTLLVSGGKMEAVPINLAVEKDALTANQVIPVTNDSADKQIITGCGQAVSGEQIVIVDPQSLTAVSPDCIGEIWVASGSVAGGYWNKPKETAASFSRELAGYATKKFLRTGDMGFLHDSELFITGRLKDMLIIRGRNHYPNDIEKTTEQSHPALEPGCGAAFSVTNETGEEQLVIVYELKHEERNSGTDEIISAIRQNVAREHEVQVYAVLLIRPKSIPRTSSGKIRRSQCKKQYLDKALKIIGMWTANHRTDGQEYLSRPVLNTPYIPPRTEIEKGLVKIWEDVLMIEPIGIDDDFFELGGDSLTAVQAFSRVRDTFGLNLQITDLLEQSTVTLLAAYIETVHWLTQESVPSVDNKKREIMEI